MGLDIGGNTITQANSALTINTGANVVLRSTGGVQRPGQTLFQAYGAQTGAWVWWSTENQWNKVPFPNLSVNTGSCFSTANSRFTAPITGRYFFQASVYLYKDLPSDGYYFHPMFWVNGSTTTGTAAAYPNYRLRGYGWPNTTYLDSQMTQTYALTAGDYVEHFIYSSGGWNGSQGNRYFPNYCRFTGFFLG